MPGLKNLFDGILKFRATVRKDLVKQFERVRDDPHPASVFFTCMDSRYVRRWRIIAVHIFSAF